MCGFVMFNESARTLRQCLDIGQCFYLREVRIDASNDESPDWHFLGEQLGQLVGEFGDGNVATGLTPDV